VRFVDIAPGSTNQPLAIYSNLVLRWFWQTKRGILAFFPPFNDDRTELGSRILLVDDLADLAQRYSRPSGWKRHYSCQMKRFRRRTFVQKACSMITRITM